MQTLTNSQFLEWARDVAIGCDERYPDAQSLAYIPNPHCSRFWCLPIHAYCWPYFASCFLSAMDPWETILVWPRAGRWPIAADTSNWNEFVHNVILRGVGVPDAWTGAATFPHHEFGLAIAIMVAHMAFGWCMLDDLYLIPHHGRQYVQVNHHGVIHVEFLEETRVKDFVAYMEANGFQLPTEVPDQSFRRPPWMSQEGNT